VTGYFVKITFATTMKSTAITPTKSQFLIPRLSMIFPPFYVFGLSLALIGLS
jgi:hypothetical protein